MVFLNEEKQSLPVAARQAVDTALSLLVNESFLKKSLDERRMKVRQERKQTGTLVQVAQVVGSFDLSPEEKAQLDEFSEEVRAKVRTLYKPEISKDLTQQF